MVVSRCCKKGLEQVFDYYTCDKCGRACDTAILYLHSEKKDFFMMTNEMLSKLRKSLIEHENFRNFPYIDTVGKITIGIGYNLTDRGLDDEWINTQYVKDVDYFYKQLYDNFPWFMQLNEDRQIVLVDMCFMGWKKFLGFGKLIQALDKSDYQKAAYEMLDSEWASQVKGRATKLAQGMLTGIYNV
jgi:lysozyme